MAEFTLVADGLRFPEGPVVMPDGSIVLVEIAAGRITRVAPDGTRTVVAEPGGGPNGLAMGPDGMLYCCNNGGFEYMESGGMLSPHGIAKDYSGGRIERIDPATGAVEVLYRSGDFGCPLRGPNDIVFDAAGGFWFTDHGKIDYEARCHDVVGIFYAKTDGSLLREVVFPSNNPNGVGLSPDGRRLYAAETYTCRLMAFDVTAPGEVAPDAGPGGPGIPVYRPAGYKFFDSLAVEASGNICVATIGESGISVISPAGELVEFVATDDVFTTNICFGGRGHARRVADAVRDRAAGEDALGPPRAEAGAFEPRPCAARGACRRPDRLAARGGAGRQRRHPVDREPDRRRRRRTGPTAPRSC